MLSTALQVRKSYWLELIDEDDGEMGELVGRCIAVIRICACGLLVNAAVCW